MSGTTDPAQCPLKSKATVSINLPVRRLTRASQRSTSTQGSVSSINAATAPTSLTGSSTPVHDFSLVPGTSKTNTTARVNHPVRRTTRSSQRSISTSTQGSVSFGSTDTPSRTGPSVHAQESTHVSGSNASAHTNDKTTAHSDTCSLRMTPAQSLDDSVFTNITTQRNDSSIDMPSYANSNPVSSDGERRWPYEPATQTVDLRNLRSTDLLFNSFSDTSLLNVYPNPLLVKLLLNK